MAGGKFGELTCFEHLVKESLANYRSANRLLIVGTNLDGFSVMNRGRFAKFAKLSRYTVLHQANDQMHVTLLHHPLKLLTNATFWLCTDLNQP